MASVLWPVTCGMCVITACRWPPASADSVAAAAGVGRGVLMCMRHHGDIHASVHPCLMSLPLVCYIPMMCGGGVMCWCRFRVRWSAVRWARRRKYASTDLSGLQPCGSSQAGGMQCACSWLLDVGLAYEAFQNAEGEAWAHRKRTSFGFAKFCQRRHVV